MQIRIEISNQMIKPRSKFILRRQKLQDNLIIVHLMKLAVINFTFASLFGSWLLERAKISLMNFTASCGLDQNDSFLLHRVIAALHFTVPNSKILLRFTVILRLVIFNFVPFKTMKGCKVL